MKRAVSLVELLIILGIIALVSAIAIPATRHYLPLWQLSAATSVVTSKLREAQEEAVTTQKKHGVCFNITSDPNEVDFVRYEEPIISTLENVKLPKNITISFPAESAIINNPDNNHNCIFFTSIGAPDVYGYITFSQDGIPKKMVDISPSGAAVISSI